MIQKILVASDGSNHAFRAAEKALELVRQLGGGVSVTLIHVSSKPPSKGSLVQAQFNVRQLLEEAAHQAVIRSELLFKNEGIPFQLAVALGDPAEEIIRKANEESFDLLIMGRRGLGMVQELVMGSVSHRAVHGACCPVMIVK